MARSTTDRQLATLPVMFAGLCFLFIALTSSTAAAAASQTTPTADPPLVKRLFTVAADRFVRDGKPFQLVAGEVHYFRIPPPYWRDRLQRVLALGVNAIQVYVPWNWHQPDGPDQAPDFTEWRDLEAFVRLAGDLGLLVLLRPGPYICAGWAFFCVFAVL